MTRTKSVTMVQKLRCKATRERLLENRVAASIALIVWLCLGTTTASFAQLQPDVHYLHQGAMPPGAIGGRQLQRGGPLLGFFQPVEIRAPKGVSVSLAVGSQTEGAFEERELAPRRVGMLIGQVYRLRVMNIPRQLGAEVFPTVEVIGRLNPPPGQEQRFAIPVVLTQQDLELALSGKFVTRVVYLEDPDSAVPNASNPDDPTDQEWLEAAPGRDPLAMADILGRPVAIIRMGSRVPDVEGPDAAFLYGCPPFESYPSRRDSAAKRPRIAKPLLAGRAVTAKPVSRKKATGKSTP